MADNKLKTLLITEAEKRTKKYAEINAIQSISQILFETEIQMHIIHLQAINKSFETHNALGDFYSSLGDLNDELVEKSFSKVGLLRKYTNIEIKNEFDPLSYIKEKMDLISENRENVTVGFIQQMIDNILETYSHVIYKLENLK